MGRTALYRDPAVFRPARAEVQLESDSLIVTMPDGRTRRQALHGSVAITSDGFVTQQLPLPLRSTRRHDKPQSEPPRIRRFVRMLEVGGTVLITPPDHGAVAPNVVRVPEAPIDAAIVDVVVWDAVAEWLLCGGRLAACSITDLARLATLATASFAAVIGEAAAQRALELLVGEGPLRGGLDLDTALGPLTAAAKASARAHEAMVAALAHAAGVRRRRFR